jgi:acetylornithine deacetylase/succinyl-diaminopimelate desuccinylase-like protein
VASGALASLGLDIDPIGMSGASDARILAYEAGVPAIVMGPGDLSLAHSAAGRIPVFRHRTGQYTNFLAPAPA